MCSNYREAYEGSIQLAANVSLAYYDSLANGPVASHVPYDELLKRFRGVSAAEVAGGLQDQSMPPESVVEELTKVCEGGLLRCSGGRFFSWVIGGTLPATVAADWLTTVWDQNAAQAQCSPAAAAAEEVVGEWILNVLRLPPTASFAITNGCTTAHLTCLAAARHRVLLRHSNWDVEADGLFGAPPIKVITTDAAHGTLYKAARLLGLGMKSFITVPSLANGEADVAAFNRSISAHTGQPIIVVLQAGEIHTGAFDAFTGIIRCARQHDAWVHVDGAFGLWCNASETRRHLLKGVEEADSWATDGHKWLNTPYDCGFAIVRDRESHFRATCLSAHYLTTDEYRNQRDWGPELSRRARGCAAWAALRQLGRQGVAALVDRCCTHCASIVARLQSGAPPGAIVLLCKSPLINQAVVHFPFPSVAIDDARSEKVSDIVKNELGDTFTARVIDRVTTGGEAFFMPSVFKGRKCMRISVCSWATTAADVDRTVAAVLKALRECSEDALSKAAA